MLLQGQEFMQEGAFNDWKMLEWSKTEQFSGIVTAHKHLIDLRKNKYKNTAGLTGQYTAIIHHDDKNTVLAYHRKDKGGPGDDVVVIANLGSDQFDEYRINLPSGGKWTVRFNSSWKGYNVDFPEKKIQSVTANSKGQASLPLAAYGVLILSVD